MDTVLSHIVQKHLSQQNENVATDALAFILQSSEAARGAFIGLLRGLAPGLPTLHFRTQQTEGSARPDMCGLDGARPRVFVENKFWAGLTENQPVGYLEKLVAQQTSPTVLLLVVPEARQETVWRELLRRLDNAGIQHPERDRPAGFVHVADTDRSPILALTSWRKLLSTIEAAIADDQQATNDLWQLRALCDAADSDAFVPTSSAELTDQRTPAFLLQLSSIVQSAVDRSVTDGSVSTKGTLPMANWEQVGRYLFFPAGGGFGAWFGTHFRLWRQYGRTPLWLAFAPTDWGRAQQAWTLLEPWADRGGVPWAVDNDWFVIGVDLVPNEERDTVVAAVVGQLKGISEQLSTAQPNPR